MHVINYMDIHLDRNHVEKIQVLAVTKEMVTDIDNACHQNKHVVCPQQMQDNQSQLSALKEQVDKLVTMFNGSANHMHVLHVSLQFIFMIMT